MYELTTLDNGLRILTVTMPHVQSVTLGCFLRVGSRYEPAEISGASHFIEHMLFKGTGRWPTPRAIAEAIEGKGGVLNASTGLETTLYWAKVAAPHVRRAFDVLSDMLLDPSFDPVEIEKERGVIGEEISYSLDTPDNLAQILVNELQWPDHPLGRDVAGSRESLGRLTREALLAYLAAHYRPANTIVGLAGQIGHKEAVALAESHLGHWQPGPEMAWEGAPPNGHGPRMRLEQRRTEQMHLVFSFAGPSRKDPDRFAVRLLNVILGEAMQSRLFQEVRERLGLAYSVDSYVTTLEDTGAVGIYAGVAPGRAEEAARAILGELDRVRQEAVPEDELANAKEFIRGRMALSLEDPFSIATWYVRQQLSREQVLEPDEALAHIDALEAADLQRVAAAVFCDERLNLAAVGPFGRNGKRFQRAVRF
ncbi:MAG TPA: pitrilysin family protein [Anaerolineae bacterium]|nr:pitrilysin family protein [Anaerolineae bacterium]